MRIRTNLHTSLRIVEPATLVPLARVQLAHVPLAHVRLAHVQLARRHCSVH